MKEADRDPKVVERERAHLVEMLVSYGIRAEYSDIFGWDLKGPLCNTQDGTFVSLNEHLGKFSVHTVSSDWKLEKAQESYGKLSNVLDVLRVIQNINPNLVAREVTWRVSEWDGDASIPAQPNWGKEFASQEIAVEIGQLAYNRSLLSGHHDYYVMVDETDNVEGGPVTVFCRDGLLMNEEAVVWMQQYD